MAYFFIFLSVVNEKSLHWHILRNFAYATYVHTKAYLVGLGVYVGEYLCILKLLFKLETFQNLIETRCSSF